MEKILPSKKKYLIGIAWALVSNIIGIFSALFITMVATRSLTKEEMGIYFFIMLIIAFANVFGDIGLGTSAIKFLAGNKSKNTHTTQYLFTINTIISIIVILIFTIGFPLLNFFSTVNISNLYYYCILLIFLTNNFNMAMSILAGYRLYKEMAITFQSIELFRMLISIGAIYYGLKVNGLLIGMIISRILGIFIIFIKIPVPIRLKFRHEHSKEMLSFSGWIYGSSVISIINVRLVDLIITSFIGASGLAAYSTAMQIPSIIQRIFESIRPVVLGYLSALDLKVMDVTLITVRLFSAFLVISATFLIALSPILITIVFSKHYHESIAIMQMLSVWMAIGLINYYIFITLVGMGFSKKAFMLGIPQLFVTLISGYLLVPDYQGIGAACSLIITSLVGNFVAFWMVALGNFKYFLKLILVYCKSTVFLFAFISIILIYHPSIALSILCWFILILLLFITKAITKDDFNFLTHKLKTV